jgi:hypothetical protein
VSPRYRSHSVARVPDLDTLATPCDGSLSDCTLRPSARHRRNPLHVLVPWQATLASLVACLRAGVLGQTVRRSLPWHATHRGSASETLGVTEQSKSDDSAITDEHDQRGAGTAGLPQVVDALELLPGVGQALQYLANMIPAVSLERARQTIDAVLKLGG